MTHPRLTNLHNLLQKALELELFTIPPYLTALYSIREGQNLESALILQGVVMEEMLHATLVANVLNAIGGAPQVSPRLAAGGRNGRGAIERRAYPSRIPHIDAETVVALQRFSQPAIETFRAVEAPEDPDCWPRPGDGDKVQSIGHLYDIVLRQLVGACDDLGEAAVFSGDVARQIGPTAYYGGGGGVIPVYNLADARDVIAEVAQQGEGRRKLSNLTGDQERFGQPKEVAHYFRFEQILAGRYYDRDDDVKLDPAGADLRVDWSAAYPMRANPSPAAKTPSGVANLIRQFTASYDAVLDALHEGFNGRPEALRDAVIAMQRLKQQCIGLMRVEIGRGDTLGPPFWFVVTP